MDVSTQITQPRRDADLSRLSIAEISTSYKRKALHLLNNAQKVRDEIQEPPCGILAAICSYSKSRSWKVPLLKNVKTKTLPAFENESDHIS